MSSSTIPSTREVRCWSPRKRKLALIAVTAWPVIVFLAWDHAFLADYDLRFFVSLLFYFCVAFKLRCGWIPFTVIAGAVFGLGSDPGLKGGTPESMMWETVNHLAGGTAIGLLVGLVLDFIPRTRQIPQNHMT